MDFESKSNPTTPATPTQVGENVSANDSVPTVLGEIEDAANSTPVKNTSEDCRNGPEEIWDFSFCQRLYLDRLDGQTCNVSLSIKDETFSAHKCILAANSEYFRDMLKDCFKDPSEPVIFKIESTAKKETFEKLLNFMYGACLDFENIPVNDIFEALELAATLRLDRFKQSCSKFARSFRSHGLLSAAYAIGDKLGLQAVRVGVTELITTSLLPKDPQSMLHDFDEEQPIVNMKNVSENLFFDVLEGLHSYCEGKAADPFTIEALEVKARQIMNFVAVHHPLDYEALKRFIEHVQFERLPMRAFDVIANNVLSDYPGLTFGKVGSAVGEVTAKIHERIMESRLTVAVFENRGYSFKLWVNGPKVTEWTDAHSLLDFKIEQFFFHGNKIYIVGIRFYSVFDVATKTLSETKTFPWQSHFFRTACICLDEDVMYLIGTLDLSPKMSLIIYELNTEHYNAEEFDQTVGAVNITVREKLVYYVNNNTVYCYDPSSRRTKQIYVVRLPGRQPDGTVTFGASRTPKLAVDSTNLYVFQDSDNLQEANFYHCIPLVLWSENGPDLLKINPSVFLRYLASCSSEDGSLTACFCRESQEIQLYKFSFEAEDFVPLGFLGELDLADSTKSVLLGQKQ